MPVRIRKITRDDRAWVEDLIEREWGSSVVVSRGRIHHPGRLPGFVAEVDSVCQGLITYDIDAAACEIVTLNSLVEGRGIGSALLEAVRDAAAKAGCSRLWLVTTNDNLPGQGFYEKRGFTTAAVHEGAIEAARRLKPEIPETGVGGAPIRDEIELEIELAQAGDSAATQQRASNPIRRGREGIVR